MSVAGRILPHDLDAERAVLGNALAFDGIFDRLVAILREEHFFLPANAAIWRAMCAIAEAGLTLNELNVLAWLRDREIDRAAGGAEYLAELSFVPADVRIEEPAARIVALWRRRKMIATCQRIAAEGYGDVGNDREWLDAAEAAVFEIASDESEHKRARAIGVVARDYIAKIQAAAKEGRTMTGAPTGFSALDRQTLGLHDGELTIVAGRPGMGKSAFAQAIAHNFADNKARKRRGVLLCSLEMPDEQIAMRGLTAEARVTSSALRGANLTDGDWSELTKAMAWMHKLPLYVFDVSGMTLLDLRSSFRHATASAKKDGVEIGLVVVDYLQLMRGRRTKSSSREEEVASVSNGLKQFAKKFRVPVIALAQLNRRVESQGNKRPSLGDLRESGAIEQDADNVILLYRDEYYNRETTTEPGIVEVDVAKQRNGPTGAVKVRFHAQFTRFEDIEKPNDHEAVFG